jgi:hypothetical protein
MSAYLLIRGDMFWRTTFSFLDFITDNGILDLKCTSVWNSGFSLKASCGSDQIKCIIVGKMEHIHVALLLSS